MALPSVTGANYPTLKELKDMFLRTILYAYEQRGITANVLPGSAYDIQAQAFAEQMSVAIANNEIALQQLSPLTAVGDNLVDIAGVFGISRRDASVAAGQVTVTFSGGAVSIPAGFQCTAPDGSKYKTSSAYVLTGSSGDVDVYAVVAGSAGNKDQGEILTWDDGSITNLSQTCLVAVGGIDGGADTDNDEQLRQRLLDKLSAQGVNGSWSKMKEWAEESSAAIQQAFLYPAVRGPGSLDVAIVGDSGDRTLNSTIVNNVTSYLEARIPGYTSLNVTTVLPVEVDVTLAATMPLPVIAGGTGGGWTDASPWPSFDARVTAQGTSTITITKVNGTGANPQVGNQIAIWDPTTEALYRYEIVAYTVSTPSTVWVCTIKPLAGSGGSYGPALTYHASAKHYVSANASNLESYIQIVVDKFKTFGPGEKTANQDLLPRAARKPPMDSAYPSDITAGVIAALLTEHVELLDMEYGVRYLNTTTTPVTTPGVPNNTADAPKIFVLKNFAIRKL